MHSGTHSGQGRGRTKFDLIESAPVSLEQRPPDGLSERSARRALEPAPSAHTLRDKIRYWARQQPNESAIVSSSHDPLRYGDLLRQIDGIAAGLRLAGIRSHHRIANAVTAGPEAVLATVGVACHTAAVPIDPKLTVAELAQRFERLGLNAVICSKGDSCAARTAAEQCGIAIIEAAPAKRKRKLEINLEPTITSVAAVGGEPTEETVAFILQTSGTTELPKFVPFSHGNMLAAAARMQAWFDLVPKDRCLSIAPAYYSHGLKVAVFTPLLTGGSIAVPSDPGIIDLDEWFDDLRPTWTSAAPPLYRALLETAHRCADTPTHNLRFVLSGGTLIGRDVREGIEDTFGIPILDHYGSSEAAQIAANLPGPGLSKAGTCGRPWPGILKIVNEGGQQIGTGERGEVLVTGPTLTAGYLENPDANRASFTEGWFHTGDIGSLDADGFLTLHGRIKELINRGGEKISPFEIEFALLQHPDVAEAAAFAVPHPRLGEDAMAAVVLRDGATATPQQLRSFLMDRVASFKVPRRVLALDTLPKDRMGKVLRGQLTAVHSKRPAQALDRASADAQQPPTQDLETTLLALWRRLLHSDDIGIDDDFFDRGGDSLLAVQALLEIERLIGHTPPKSLLFEAATVRQLLPRLSEPAHESAGSLLHLNATGARRPLLFFHGDYERNSPYFLVRLARLLGPEQPILGIPPHGVSGERVPSTIEAMAAQRLPALRREQREGPYRLGGFCNGAVVAFETARLLKDAGQDIETLILIDSPSLNLRPVPQKLLTALGGVSEQLSTSAWRWLARAEKASRLSFAEKRAYFQAGVHARRDSSRLSKPADAPSPPANGGRAVYLQHQFAMARYRPAPINVRAVYYSGDYGGSGWSRLLPGLEIVPLPGGHYGSLTEHVGKLAEHLKLRLLHETDPLCSSYAISH
jgi:acyl-CoA synthetase (AMP-forming)/AMP-acid ligase II/thioesterase domain-containing protein